MELSWLTRIKVTAVLALGVIVYGVFLWPFVAPADPMGTANILSSGILSKNIIITLLAAFGLGFLAYFISWPYGRQIGVLAVPAGLAAWTLRSGNMAELMRAHTSALQRHEIYNSLSWEGFIWFAFAAAGFVGVLAAAAVLPSSGVPEEFAVHAQSKSRMGLRPIAAIAVSAIAVAAGISILAKDVSFADRTFGSVIGQPANRQIDFAVLISFGFAAYFVKLLLDASYIWPAITTILFASVSMNLCGREDVLKYMAANWPAAFFTQPYAAILPIQFIAFGIIGAVTGYWLAVRWKYWKEHQSR
jgi:hypothetical protein